MVLCLLLHTTHHPAAVPTRPATHQSHGTITKQKVPTGVAKERAPLAGPESWQNNTEEEEREPSHWRPCCAESSGGLAFPGGQGRVSLVHVGVCAGRQGGRGRLRGQVQEVPDQDGVVVGRRHDLEVVELQPEHAPAVLLQGRPPHAQTASRNCEPRRLDLEAPCWATQAHNVCARICSGTSFIQSSPHQKRRESSKIAKLSKE